MSEKNNYKFVPVSSSSKSEAKKSTGVSISAKGRLLISVWLQEKLGMNPNDKKTKYFVDVLQDESNFKEYIFQLQFYKKDSIDGRKLYPVQRPVASQPQLKAMYLEFARFLKEQNETVDEVRSRIARGTVKVEEFDKDTKTLIISLKNNFKKSARR